MEIEEDRKQWHPAFCAAIELEFREDNDILFYEREHNLSKKPLEMDLLVIKKDLNRVLKNEIGDFFRGHNILEYKSPGDELGIDDFYKVFGYACIYKEETGGQNEISDTDITISLVREGRPDALLDYLSGKCKVREKSSGIYRVEGLLFPLQILVTGKLDPVFHAWLCSLTRSLKKEEAESLLDNYSVLENTGDRKNAGVIVNFVSNVNNKLFLKIVERNGRMTEELKRLIAPEIVGLRETIKEQAEVFAQEKAAWTLERTNFTKREADFTKREADFTKREADFTKKEADFTKKEAALLKRIEELEKKQSKN